MSKTIKYKCHDTFWESLALFKIIKSYYKSRCSTNNDYLCNFIYPIKIVSSKKQLITHLFSFPFNHLGFLKEKFKCRLISITYIINVTTNRGDFKLSDYLYMHIFYKYLYFKREMLKGVKAKK